MDRRCARSMLAVLLQLALLCTLVAGPAQAADATAAALDQTEALRASRAALGGAVDDFTLVDRAGRAVRLAGYRGKPLVVSFIYTGCFQVCPLTTRTLQQAVIAAQARFGTGKFNVISIGFNLPADSPQALKSYAAQHGIDQPDWEFLSPQAGQVPALAQQFGFSYLPTAAGFDHTLQVSVVDADGRLYRQLYGDTYGADTLLAPLQQLLSGKPQADTASLADMVDKVRLLCSVYDPLTGTYRVRYGLVFEIAGFATFALWLAWFFWSEWRARRIAGRRRTAP